VFAKQVIKEKQKQKKTVKNNKRSSGVSMIIKNRLTTKYAVNLFNFNQEIEILSIFNLETTT